MSSSDFGGGVYRGDVLSTSPIQPRGVVLGDGPLVVLLRHSRDIELVTADNLTIARLSGHPSGGRFMMQIRDNILSVVWSYTAGEGAAYYQYVRLLQADGVRWHGWSGYGEEACEARMRELWPGELPPLG